MSLMFFSFETKNAPMLPTLYIPEKTRQLSSRNASDAPDIQAVELIV